MTDVIITDIGDTYVDADTNRDTVNFGSVNRVRVKAVNIYRGLLRPPLPNIAGRTVTSATLVGHAVHPLSAQTLTLYPITERWSPGSATWVKQPAVDSGSGLTTTIGSVAVGGPVEWDVTEHIQAVADGTDWFGWRLATDSTATNQGFFSTDSGEPAWELHITLSDTPDQPTDLRPDSGSIADTTPILSWTFDDAGLGASGQAQSRVQVDTPAALADPDEVTPDYDSTFVANIDPEWDLTGEHTLSGAGPHYWRVAVKDGDGNESAWSDWAEFTIGTFPSLVVDSPTGTFGDPTPVVAAHLSSGTVAQWEAMVTGPDRSDVRAKTGTQTGAISWTVPLTGKDGRRALIDDRPGWIYIRVYPSGDWVTAVGQPTYVDTWIEAAWDDDLGVEAPTNLTVVQTADGSPRLEWVWERTEDAGAWLAQAGDVTLARIEPEDVVASAGTYTWVDGGQVSPLREQTLTIRAIEDDQRSTGASVAGHSHVVEGVWLLPEAEGIDPIQLDGTAVSGFTRNDYASTYTTSTGEEIDIIQGTPGRTATFEGSIDATAGIAAVWAAIDAIEALRASRDRKAQLVWGSKSVAGRVRDPDATPHDDIDPDNLQHTIRFRHVEALG